jgi:signal transduction histidine kinase
MTIPAADSVARPGTGLPARVSALLARPVVRDVLAALLLLAVWNVAIAVGLRSGWYPAIIDPYVWVGVGCALAVALSRTVPAVAYVLVGITTSWPQWIFDPPELRVLPLILGVFLAASHGLRLRFALPLTLVFLVGTLVPLYVLDLVGQGDVDSALESFSYANPSMRVLLGVVVLAALLLGAATRRQRVAVETLRVRNIELQQLREADRARIAAEERTALARDIHDVVAHHVSAMVIRAQAADRVADTRPGELRETVRWIGESGQAALSAMRQVVRVLRTDSTSSVPLAPADFSVALEAVLAHVRATGLRVDATLDVASPLTPGQESTVLRIVQESLTNVMLHSGAAAVTVSLGSGPDAAWLRVEDDGGGPDAVSRIDAANLAAGGSGLRGMRERAEALGGTFSAGPLAGRGWLVEAVLPHAAVAGAHS